MELIATLLVLRVVATIATVGAGGVGGVFIPLATQGVLLGSLVAGVLGDPDSALFPTIGLAAVLGAAHRTPLAGVMFVAETSSSVFVIPALIAAAVSQLVAADSSVLRGQAGERKGHLEARLDLPLASTLRTDGPTVAPDLSVNDFVVLHVIGERERSVPVIDGDRVVGLCSLDEVATVAREEWDTTPVSAIARTDVVPAGLTWTLREAVGAMDRAGVDLLPVCDDGGGFVGVVSESEIVKLCEILDETEH
jgi:CIC family chloride channel protein